VAMMNVVLLGAYRQIWGSS